MNDVLLLSFVTGSISFTLTETKIFSPLRDWLKAKIPILGELWSCGYCLGHWIALTLVAIYQPRVLQCWWPLDLFLAMVMVAWFGGIQWVVMCILVRQAGK